jgi:hypothetical protein
MVFKVDKKEISFLNDIFPMEKGISWEMGSL